MVTKFLLIFLLIGYGKCANFGRFNNQQQQERYPSIGNGVDNQPTIGEGVEVQPNYDYDINYYDPYGRFIPHHLRYPIEGMINYGGNYERSLRLPRHAVSSNVKAVDQEPSIHHPRHVVSSTVKAVEHASHLPSHVGSTIAKAIIHQNSTFPPQAGSSSAKAAIHQKPNAVNHDFKLFSIADSISAASNDYKDGSSTVKVQDDSHYILPKLIYSMLIGDNDDDATIKKHPSIFVKIQTEAKEAYVKMKNSTTKEEAKQAAYVVVTITFIIVIACTTICCLIISGTLIIIALICSKKQNANPAYVMPPPYPYPPPPHAGRKGDRQGARQGYPRENMSEMEREH